MAYNTVTVSTAATLIIAANPKRRSYIIQNMDSSKTLYIGQDASITIANTIEIPGNGGSISEDSGGDRLYQGPVYGLSDTGTIDVRYWERE